MQECRGSGAPHLASPALRLLVVDDHPILRAGLRAVLSAHREFDIVGEAESGEAALRLLSEVGPDLVLLDFSLPGMTGDEVARRIKRERTGARLLCVSVHDDVAIVRRLLDAGADGYLLKRSACDELVPAVRQVAAGTIYLDPALPRLPLPSCSKQSTELGFEVEVLSDREAEVGRLLAQGLTMKEIAQQLNLSPRTLETYRARAMEKLGLKTRADLIRYATRRGWLAFD